MAALNNYSELLKILQNDPYSQLKLVNSKMHLALPPKYIANIRSGILDNLTSKLKLYDEDLLGVVMAFNNIKLLQNQALLPDEQPFLQFDIQADFILFKPYIGCTVKGKVNKLSKKHVGCLVHSCFNASAWRKHGAATVEENPETDLKVGDDILLKIAAVFTNNDVLSMKGVIVQEPDRSLPEMNTRKRRHSKGSVNETPKKKSKRDSMETPAHIANISKDFGNLSAIEPVSTSSEHKLKKRKRKEDVETPNGEVDSFGSIEMKNNEQSELQREITPDLVEHMSSVTESINTEEHGKKKKKKKKHKRDQENEQCDMSVHVAKNEMCNNTNMQSDSGVSLSLESNSDVYAKKKKKDKRKYKDDT